MAKNTLSPSRDTHTVFPNIKLNAGISKLQSKNSKHLKNANQNLNTTDMKIRCLPKSIQIRAQKKNEMKHLRTTEIP